MAKKILPLLLLALALQVGCSSSDEGGAETDDSVSEELQAESSGDGGSDSSAAAENSGEAKSEDVAAEEGAPAEEGAVADDGGVVDEKAGGDEVVADLGDEADLKKLEEEIPDAAPEEKTAEAKPDGFGEGAPVDQAAAAPPADPLAGDAPPAPEATPTTDVAAAPAPAPVAASLKKIKDAPFEKSGTNLNTVYLARDGDTAESIAQKIYGDESRKSDLKAWNSHIKRGVKTGDKIYYNSPQRPDDRDKMMIFYEDRGVPAETYVSQPGDNIKDLAEKFIGSRNSWKELWATNPVESKGKLPPGTELRYWPQGAGDGAPAPTQELAQQPKTEQTPPPPPQAANNLPPPPPADASPAGAAGTVGANMPPPPPPGGEAAPVAAKPQVKKKGGGLGDMDQETTFMLSVGGLLLVGSGVLMAIVKKNRARRLHEGQTQI